MAPSDLKFSRGDDGSMILKRTTWFRVTAAMVIGPRFLHRAGFGNLLIPHPPVVNWLLRKGLPEEIGLGLAFEHEFAHFQTLPGLAVYAFLLFFVFANGMPGGPWLLPIAAHIMAVWEMASEGLIIIGDPDGYRNAYKNVGLATRLVFWTSCGILTAAGWAAIL